MLHQSRPSFTHYDRPVTDTLTEAGAMLLAEVIRCHWREKGKTPPQMRIERFFVPHARRGSVTQIDHHYVSGGTWAVRSDMVGGLPRRLTE